MTMAILNTYTLDSELDDDVLPLNLGRIIASDPQVQVSYSRLYLLLKKIQINFIVIFVK